MKLLKAILISFTIVISTIIHASPASELTDLLSSFHSLTANFTQTVYGGGDNLVTQQAQGTVAIQRPGKFRWDITKPNRQLIITDGKLVWIYDADLQQATQQKLAENQANSPAMLLSGSAATILKRFDVQAINEQDKSGSWFKLIPKTSGDLFQWVELHFVNKQLVGMRLFDNLGSLSAFNFSRIQLNKSLPNNLFVFNPPADVDVIKND